MEKSYHFDLKRFIKDFLFIVLLLSLGLYIVMFFMEYKDIEIKSVEYKKAEEQLLDMQVKYIADEFGIIANGITYVAKSVEKYHIDEPNDYTQAEDWILFLNSMPIYHQASLLNRDGKRIFSIQHDFSGSYETIAGGLYDQEQSAFEKAKQLKDGQIYIGPLTLKQEKDEYVTPFVPLITIAVPVFYENEYFGVVILHYDATYTLMRFKDISEWGSGEISLITNEGYWIYNTHNDDLQGQFELQNISYDDYYPSAWQQIIKGNTQFQNEEGLFTVKSLNLLEYLESIMREDVDYDRYVIENIDWKIISRIDPDSKIGYYTSPSLYKILMNIFENKLIYIFMIILFALLVTILKDYNRRAKLRIKYYATHDGMTDLWNRKTGLEVLNSKLPSQNKRKSEFAICYIDINGLKQVNDTLGHKYGDELILDVCLCLKNSIRKTDFAIRMGGDEFMLILNDVNLKEAKIVWQHIEEKVENLNNQVIKPYLVSISHGMICSTEAENYTAEELIVEGDKRMYQNKIQLKKNLQVIRI